MKQKVLIIDSGTLITLAMNGLLDVLSEFKKTFEGKFIITNEVKYEVIDHPIEVQRFELDALRVQNLIDSGVLELPDSVEISNDAIKKKTRELMEIANHSVRIIDRWMKIVSDAEISCLALSYELEKKGFETLVAIDERTTRMLIEKPENLEKIMSEKMHHKVEVVTNKLKAFESFRIIRSSEIVFVAFKKGLINIKGKKALEALLYATKFKGASISFEEINELKKL